MKNVKLFLDLDGVMADFDSRFKDLFGVDQHGMSDEEMWKKINAVPDYFLSMDMCKGAKEFLDSVMHLNPTILTACPKTNYRSAALQKRQWVRNNLSKDMNVIPMMGGKNKCLFMHGEGDVLIDDFEKNCKPWDELGGVSIVHKDFNTTINKMKEIGLDV